MDGHNKRFSLGWYVGLALGIVGGTAATVYAVTLPNTFQDGQVASAAAVNANFKALSDAIDGCSAGMARAGASCVDTDASVATSIPAGCQATGAGCGGIVVASKASATSTVPMSWGQAVAACTNAGKRLATGREIIAATNSGAITLTDGDTLYVDASAARSAGSPYAGTHVSYNSGVFELLGTNTSYTEQFGSDIVAFRCAR